MREVVWSVDAYGRTPKQAAEEFARTFWRDGPRRLIGWTAAGRFRTSGGVAWYRVAHIGLATPCRYDVVREQTVPCPATGDPLP